MKNMTESIKQFLKMARERNLDVNGSAEEWWFIINGIKLDSRFNVPQTKVMIKIRAELNDAVILIPNDVVIRPDAGISCDFITTTTAGWNCIFLNTFLDVNGEIIELVFSVAGALANLSLYNLVSKKDITKPAEVIPVEVTRINEESSDNLLVIEQNRRNENGIN
jgi:hypothetical protein